MEFKVTTDLTTAIPQEIAFNFDEMKAWLSDRLEHYNNLVITEDTIKEGKEDRATLNKLRTAIDTRRKEIKKAWNAPYNAFEARIKELTAMIDKPIAVIDNQLDEYELMRIAEKDIAARNLYDETVPEELKDIIPYHRIADRKWLNATTTLKKIAEELTAIVKRTEADMLVLDTVEPEYAAAVRETYIRTLDIQTAMQQKKAIQAAAEAFKEREARQATPQAESPAQPACEPEIERPAPQPEQETIYTLRLEMRLTKSQANALKVFLNNNNIEHTKI